MFVFDIFDIFTSEPLVHLMTLTLDYLNHCKVAAYATALTGLYKNSDWVVERSASSRPFISVAAFKLALQNVVTNATPQEKLALARAHSGLAGNAGHSVADELAECLRQIHRIAELRLNTLLNIAPSLGASMMDAAELLSQWSDDPHHLTCCFLQEAHCRTAEKLGQWMSDAGMSVCIDALGNVKGRYLSDDPEALTILIGSHYDTVRNGGKYDGRAGILLAIEAVGVLSSLHEKLPHHIEIIGFSDEEGVRFSSTFLGSSAVAGLFDPKFLEQIDIDGISMRTAIKNAGHDPETIASIACDPSKIAGYLEIHIEQGPVLLNEGLPVGIVTSIAGSCRYMINLTGVAGHAGTTPMNVRHDAAAAAAEIVLYVEKRCQPGKKNDRALATGLVGTVGKLTVPDGSVNVIPGACQLSLDIRAADDTVRDAAVHDILNAIASICVQRGIGWQVTPLMRAAAVPCSPRLMKGLASAVERAGVPPFFLSSGAGHDAMMIAKITEVAMLFVRCGNGGISHNPLETMTADDADLSARIVLDFLRNFLVQ